MSSEEKDELEKALDFDESSTRSPEDKNRAAQRIVSRAKRQKGRSDFLEFGFVKMWSVVLEFLGLFYVEYKRKKDFKPPKDKKVGVKDEL